MDLDYTKIRTYVREARKDNTNCYNDDGKFMSKRECRKIIIKQQDLLAKYKGLDYSPYANTRNSKFAQKGKKEPYSKFR